MRRTLALLFTTAVLAAVSAPLSAHHGTAAFELAQMVTLKGVVTELQFVNPHVQVYFDVKNDKGEAEKWQAELTAPTKLQRGGWTKRTLKPGDAITITGNVGKDGKHIMWPRKLIGPNGEPLPLNENDQNP
jgi:hypothetical protein